MPVVILGGIVIAIGALLYYKEQQAGNAQTAQLTAAVASLSRAQAPPSPAAVSSVGTETQLNANATTIGAEQGISAAETVAQDAASGNIAGAVTAGVSAIITQITQHSARLQGAKTENTAADLVVPAFDADIQAINSAYRGGEITQAQAEQALVQVLQYCYNSLYALVGKPGTAWSGSAGAASAGQVPCNKACTVSCCIYWNDLYCAIYGCSQFGASGALQAIKGQGSRQPAAPPGTPLGSLGPYQSYVPEVYPPDDSAYGNFSRPAYNLIWTPPSSVPASVAQHVIESVTPAPKPVATTIVRSSVTLR